MGNGTHFSFPISHFPLHISHGLMFFFSLSALVTAYELGWLNEEVKRPSRPGRITCPYCNTPPHSNATISFTHIYGNNTPTAHTGGSAPRIAATTGATSGPISNATQFYVKFLRMMMMIRAIILLMRRMINQCDVCGHLYICK